MTALVNGVPWEADGGATVADLVATWCESPRGVAVARNGEVVPKSRWADVTIGPTDTFEIVTASAGG
jgi:sulfur carrier protein